VPLLAIAVVACSLTVGCKRPHFEKKSVNRSPIEMLATRDLPRNPAAETRTRGRNVFMHYCAICHGDTGQGDGFNSSNLEVAPRDFSNPEFWQRSTDDHLLLVVSNGGPAVGRSVLMPAWGRTLTDRELHDVVTYLRAFDPEAAPALNREPQ
jgi:mono/diheme cytochrome c family protein